MAKRDTEAVRQSIIRTAIEAGVNPAYALAVAQRESDFDPRARSSKTIAGVYQMRGDLRSKYGVGNSADPYTQAQGWARSLNDIRSEMARILGRQPTDQEAYLGHHYGATRAARTLKMDPDTPVSAIFTRQEMAGNPHFARAATIGNLNSSVMGDIGQRMARFGGPASTEPADLSSFGEPVLDASFKPTPSQHQAGKPDLSMFGTVADPTAGPRTRVAGDVPVNAGPDYQGNFDRNKKWSKLGNYRTDLGDQEPAFRKWVQDNKVPFDVNRTGPDDYDMRGFWKGAQQGDPRASTAPNPNDGLIHYDDKWKTPYHKSFSSESQWAQPNAPRWNDQDQLIDPSNGGVVYDEKAPQPAEPPSPTTEPSAPVPPPQAPDLSSFGTPVA